MTSAIGSSAADPHLKIQLKTTKTVIVSTINLQGLSHYTLLVVVGLETHWRWSYSCPVDNVNCGLQTSVEEKQEYGDDTSLNSAKFL